MDLKCSYDIEFITRVSENNKMPGLSSISSLLKRFFIVRLLSKTPVVINFLRDRKRLDKNYNFKISPTLYMGAQKLVTNP